jgi:hypothetical protein
MRVQRNPVEEFGIGLASFEEASHPLRNGCIAGSPKCAVAIRQLFMLKLAVKPHLLKSDNSIPLGPIEHIPIHSVYRNVVIAERNEPVGEATLQLPCGGVDELKGHGAAA